MMNKILILQNKLLHYRKSFYNELSKNFEVLVLHSGSSCCLEEDRFKELIVPTTRIGPFWYQHRVLDVISELEIDAIIAMFDIRWINTIRAMYMWDNKLPWIWWGLDEGDSTLALRAKLFFAARNNPIVFYNKLVRDRFLDLGIDESKLFIGNNTFHVPNRIPCYKHRIKNKFINVGSLDKRKQNDISILAFKKVLLETGKDLQYFIIGEGSERQKLEHLIEREKLTKKVFLVGKITDPKKLTSYYEEAIASVSFGQAGLAVLQSLAMGVPFITKENAISGGEKNNIITGENGWFCEDDPTSLKKIMIRLVNDVSFARSLGENAYNYYTANCTVEKMVQGFVHALQYCNEYHK